jgi:hypothetical protein
MMGAALIQILEQFLGSSALFGVELSRRLPVDRGGSRVLLSGYGNPGIAALPVRCSSAQRRNSPNGETLCDAAHVPFHLRGANRRELPPAMENPCRNLDESRATDFM